MGTLRRGLCLLAPRSQEVTEIGFQFLDNRQELERKALQSPVSLPGGNVNQSINGWGLERVFSVGQGSDWLIRATVCKPKVWRPREYPAFSGWSISSKCCQIQVGVRMPSLAAEFTWEPCFGVKAWTLPHPVPEITPTRPLAGSSHGTLTARHPRE